MLKLGMYLLRDATLSDEERLRIMRSTGFDFVCLGTSPYADGDLAATVALCERLDIPVENVHLTGSKTSLIWNEGDEGEAIADRYCREIEYVSSLGVKTGIAHVTWGKSAVAPINETALCRYERIAECAEKNGFVLALENSVYPEYLYAVMDRVRGSRGIGYCFDSGHRNAFAPTEDFLGRFGDILAATHLQDNNGKNDRGICHSDKRILQKGSPQGRRHRVGIYRAPQRRGRRAGGISARSCLCRYRILQARGAAHGDRGGGRYLFEFLYFGRGA